MLCSARGWIGARIESGKRLKEKGNIINRILVSAKLYSTVVVSNSVVGSMPVTGLSVRSRKHLAKLFFGVPKLFSLIDIYRY